jgi:hypothetical protein
MNFQTALTQQMLKKGCRLSPVAFNLSVNKSLKESKQFGRKKKQFYK